MAVEQIPEFTDRDLLIALLNAVCGLAARLGGGQLVLCVTSERTGRTVAVDGATLADAFRPTPVPENG